MNANADIVINRSIKIIQNTGKLQITKSFGDNNLSKSALKYAEKTDTHYLYDWGRTSFISVFELPKLFNIAFPEVLRFMVNYCLPYMQENELTDAVIYTKFMDNYKKELK
jgi:hypothetical protein